VTTKKPDIDSVTTKTEAMNMIVFLKLKISKTANSENSIVDLISKKEVKGKLNDPREPQQAQYNDYLTIDLLDKDDNTVSSTILEHPLYKRVEYTAEENKQLVTRSLSLNEDIFFVRLHVKSIFSKIVISESLNKSEKKRIGTITL
jgi:hypothetical protein